MNRIAKIWPAIAAPSEGVKFKGVQAFTAARMDAATSCLIPCSAGALTKVTRGMPITTPAREKLNRTVTSIA